MQAAPMKIGMYHFKKMLTSKSTPAVVTVSTDRVRVETSDEVLLDAPAQQVQFKKHFAGSALTLKSGSTSVIVAAVGSEKGGGFTPEQEAEITAAQEAAVADPAAGQLDLGRTLWIGRPATLEGTMSGAFIAFGDAKDQRTVNGIVADALQAVGASAA